MAGRRPVGALLARRVVLTASLLAIGAGALSAAPASAALSAIGPIDNATGYPRTFTDTLGTKLELCLDDADLCLSTPPDATQPASVPANFPGEAFWWSAEAAMPTPFGDDARVVLALEAAFGTGEVPKAGDQIAFGRIRVRMDDAQPGATYHVVHPYGEFDAEADDRGRVFATADVGCFDNCAARNFSPLLTTNVGPFLRWSNQAPSPPTGYIGDPGVEHRVTGSPTGTNLVRITGPGLPPTTGVNTDLFAVSGKLAGPAPTPAPLVSLDRESVDFGSREINTASPRESVTVKNIGEAPLNVGALTKTGANPADFEIAENGCTAAVAPNASCTIKLNLRATTVGAKTATLGIPSNAPGAAKQVSLFGVGDPPPPTAIANLSPLSVDFGDQAVGTPSAARSVTLTNTGDGSMDVGSAQINGAAAGSYAIAADDCPATLAPEADCSVAVRFTPAAAGTRAATLRFGHSARGAREVALTGTGAGAPPPEVANVNVSPGSLAFAAQNAGTPSAAQTITVSNTGGAAAAIAGVETGGPQGAEFPTTSTCGLSLPAGGQCAVTVRFQPTAAGSRTGRITINDDSPTGPHVVNLAGTGVVPPPPAPGMSISPAAVAFSTVSSFSNATRTVTVTSNGTTPLVTGAVSLTGANPTSFSQNDGCSNKTLAPGATCTITVTFRSQALVAGTRNATLNVPSNAPPSPRTVPVSGTHSLL